MTNRAAGGFTLIELMIIVAVVAILAAIALPSYQSAVRKSRRAEALAVISAEVIAQERRRANNTAYSATFLTAPGPSSTYYTYSVAIPAGAGATNFTVTATAIAGKGQQNDTAGGSTCSPLTLDQSGTKLPAACWK
jgi:type IV pilus assembly protein PilE